ncbi:MAG: sn-glycerol-1-phosphate dehydrogenase [Clostridia bacterium]|nr:sn-glycerol-1-phosphate dehydrogenase [Clostridia bacterium]
MTYSIDWLMENDGFECVCGKRHYGLLKDCIIGENALMQLPQILRKYTSFHPFILCDTLTYAAAGERLTALLENEKIPYTIHFIERIHPAPDEKIVGEALMYCDAVCDTVIAVGGGVINDTCKILASAKNVPDIYVATAPSMDGFASASSSMERGGLKVSLNSKCPDAVIGDAEILANAPTHMIRSGIGDMVAKYVSIVEWQIAALLLGEYYCPEIAEIVRASLNVCVKVAKDAVNGDRDAVCRLTEGLVMSGLAMNYAGISRPASGMEHYISHIIDMRALEFGTPADLHGIQCGMATLLTVQAYEKLLQYTPDREKALNYVNSFSLDNWFNHLREQLGHGAEAMIAGERKEQKYDKIKHAERLEKILSNYDEICRIAGELPSSVDLRTFFESIGHPVSGQEFGLTETELREAFLMAKDIRDKYVIGRMLWDFGILEEFADSLVY